MSLKFDDESMAWRILESVEFIFCIGGSLRGVVDHRSVALPGFWVVPYVTVVESREKVTESPELVLIQTPVGDDSEKGGGRLGRVMGASVRLE
jgi:hypothetical protein